jgi:hypothetical protein
MHTVIQIKPNQTMESNNVLKSDVEKSNEQEQIIDETLTTIGDALNHASQMLDGLENDGILGSAIRRYAADIATSVGIVARDLECGEDEESRKKWARALIDDAQSQLALEAEGTHSADPTQPRATQTGDSLVPLSPPNEMSAAKAVSELSENDVMDAMAVARTILLDVEDALMSISEDDAEEIADVGLLVVKMFLYGLQNVHSQITPNMIKSGFKEADASMDIEILDDDGNETGEHISSGQGQRRDERMRILWPPIGPAFISIASWGKDSAVKNPILSIALGMTLWPAAVIGAFISGPILAADWCLQSGYEAVKDQIFVETAEKSATNLYNVGKFYFLVSKLMVKQSCRVGKRQIHRRGGIEKIAKDAGGWTVDRALHPIESAGMLWNSAKWSAGKVVEGVEFVKDAGRRREDDHIARNVIN